MFTRSLLALIAFSAVSLFAADPVPPNFRLGDKVLPEKYRINLTILPEHADFTGAVDIDLFVREPSPVIWLNATELNVREATFKSGAATKTAKVVVGGVDFVGFEFEEPLASGNGTLHVTFQGKLNTNASHGLFKAKQGDHEYVYTQFESIEARRAFPCFDEPGFKVPFQVSIRTKRENHAFSNTPVASTSVMSDGMVLVRFKETPPLPAYLVAMAVGPFEVIDAGKAGKNHVPVRIITPRGRRDEGAYAAKVTASIIDEEEKYFGVPYPYEKADAISVPRLGGAMENPGLITYDEGLILIKPSDETTQRQKSYASVAAHELGHQWFGDLVTMAWWNDTWLNEAFATWTANKIIERWKPEWSTSADKTAARLGVESLDTLVSARKIRQPVETKNDIANAFDNITYIKGGAVIRMFEYWMGPDKFQQGVRNYLTKYRFKNARAEDFFAEMGAVSNGDVPPAFTSFVEQAGLPELSVALECRNGETPSVKLSQKRYLPIGSAGATAETWHLPVCVSYEGGRECQMMKAQTSEMKLSAAKSCPAWVMPNADETAYYVTRFEGGLLEKLLAARGGELTAAERLGILGDSAFSMNAGASSPAQFLMLVDRFHRDPDREVVTRQITTLESMWKFVPANARANYGRFVEAMFGERSRQLGWKPVNGESENDRLLRPTLVEFVGEYGSDSRLREQAQKLAAEWLDDRNAVSPEIVSAVLSVAALEGNQALYDKMLAAAKQSKNIREQSMLLSALGHYRDQALAQRSLQLLLSGDFDMRSAYRPLLFGPLSWPATQALPWTFVRENYPALEAKLAGGLVVSQGAWLPSVATASCNETDLPAIQNFFNGKVEKFSGGPRSYSQAIERLHICSAQQKSLGPGIAGFLQKY